MASLPVNAAHSDGQNQQFSAIGVMGTLGTADVQGTALTLPFSVDPSTGAAYVKSISGISTPFYNNGTVSYPDGTTEIYKFLNGTTPVGSVTLTYLDTNKGSLSTFTTL